MNINDLYTNRAKAWEEAKAFLDSHTAENGTLSAEDAQTYERMEADINNISNQIERQQRLDEIENQMNQPATQPIVARPAKADSASDEYRQKFDAYLRGRIFGNELSPMIEGTPTRGGYLVPEEFERQVIEQLPDVNAIRSIAHVIRTTGDHHIPVALTHGQAVYTGEGEAYTETEPTFDRVTMKAYKLARMTTVSEEMLQDSAVNVEQMLANDIAISFGTTEERSCAVGDGTNGPTGIFTENGGTVGVTTTGANLTVEDIMSIVYALRAPYRRNAKFLMNDSTVACIRKMKDGQGIYLWQPSLAMGQPDKLMGYDLVTSAYAPTVAAGARVVAFGDFNYFWIADRTGLTVQRLNERYADLGLIGFKAYMRNDAKVVLPEAIQLIQMHSA